MDRTRARFAVLATLVIATLLPASTKTDPRAREVLEQFLKTNAARLGTEPDSPYNHFRFVLEINVVREGLVDKAMDVVVARDGARNGFLVRYADGLPAACAVPGLIAFVDPDRPGKIMVIEGADPEFGFVSGEQGTMLHLAGRDPGKGSLILGVRGVTDPKPREHTVHFDPVTHDLYIRTQHAICRVDVGDHGLTRPYRFLNWSLSDDSRHVAVLRDFTFDPRITGRALGLTNEHLRAAGLELTPLSGDEIRNRTLIPTRNVLDEGPARDTAIAFLKALKMSLPSSTTQSSQQR